MVQINKEIEWGWVTYGKPNQFSSWKNQWAHKINGFYIINNKSHDSFGESGSNEYSEFSGYLEVIEKFRGTGPFILCNDTWFKTHYPPIWNRLLKNAITQMNDSSNAIYGDIRWDKEEFIEKPSPYLSSWIFLIPNKPSLEEFKETLLFTLRTLNVKELSNEYKSYVASWISPSNKWKGWHKMAIQSSDIKRKTHSIYLEHYLNNNFKHRGIQIRSLGMFNPTWYFAVRIIDRLRTRFKAWNII